MKLTCGVILLKEQQQNSKPKPNTATLTIFRESKKKPVQLRIMSANTRKLDIYLNDGNLAKIISKRVDDGMATLFIKDPPMQILMNQADPVQLSAFLRVLKSVDSCGDLPSMPNAVSSSQQASIAPKLIVSKMEITQRRDYPFWTPIPTTLTVLKVANCRLTEFDKRILKMNRLTHLSLVGNDFSNGRLNDVSLGQLQRLTTLDLADNQIDQISDEFISRLPTNLNRLSLKGNRLTTVPDILFNHGRLSLTWLDLSNNELTKLSKQIDRKLRAHLKYLLVAQNRLPTVPAWIGLLQLNQVDFSGNQFAPVSSSTQQGAAAANEPMDVEQSFPTLLEMSAACIVQNKIPTSLLPPGLQQYVQYVSTLECDVCGRASLPSRASTERYSYDLRFSAATVATAVSENSFVTLEGVCCLEKCATQFRSGRCFKRS